MNENELQQLLSVYRCQVPMPNFRAHVVMPSASEGAVRAGWSQRWWLAAAAIFAAVAIVVGTRVPRPNQWREGLRVLRVGDVVRTGSKPVRIKASAIGTIDIGENTTIRIVETRKRRHRLELTSGTIHAKTTSPPGVFVVDTPNASAIDLGCEYDLTIAPGGGGVLRVSAGWVELARGYAEAVVPAGAAAMVSARGELSAPYFEDAPYELREAVRRFSFGGGDRSADLQTILTRARVKDGLTVINLFSRATPDERPLIFDRLNRLVPAPPGITRESVRWWGSGTTAAWWAPVLKASGVQPLKKKKK